MAEWRHCDDAHAQTQTERESRGIHLTRCGVRASVAASMDGGRDAGPLHLYSYQTHAHLQLGDRSAGGDPLPRVERQEGRLSRAAHACMRQRRHEPIVAHTSTRRAGRPFPRDWLNTRSGCRPDACTTYIHTHIHPHTRRTPGITWHGMEPFFPFDSNGKNLSSCRDASATTSLNASVDARWRGADLRSARSGAEARAAACGAEGGGKASARRHLSSVRIVRQHVAADPMKGGHETPQRGDARVYMYICTYVHLYIYIRCRSDVRENDTYACVRWD
jgi:hypothetical protein